MMSARTIDHMKVMGYLLLLVVSMGLISCASADRSTLQPSPTPIATATPVATPVATATRQSWLILPELPATASDADVGAEIYRLVCHSCHGNKGQGLTDEWRAEWNPKDQNCWQSKCHAGNHPPDGFILPREVPPIMGPGSLPHLDTTLALYNYIRVTMPWHSPGSLQDEEYRQLTAFLARERRSDPLTPSPTLQ